MCLGSCLLDSGSCGPNRARMINSHAHRTYPPADLLWAISRGCEKFNHSAGRCEGKKKFKTKQNQKPHKTTTKPDMLSVDLSSLLALGLRMLGLPVSSILTLSINRRNHYRIKIRLFQKATSLLRPIPAFLNLHLAGFVSRPFHTKHNNKSNLIRIEP